MRDEQLQKAGATWDTIDINQVRNVGWLTIDHYRKRIEEKMTNSYKRPLDYLLRERYSDDERLNLKGLALVCGDMTSERCYFEEKQDIRFTDVHGYDLSTESIKRFHTDSFCFTPHIMDVNDLILPSEEFDLAVGNHGIHHVFNLGGLFYQTHKSLKSRGLFVVHEWIGPKYLQLPLRNHIIATLVLLILFPLRNSRRNHMGQIKGLWLQYTPESFDPSEACNSEELLPQLNKYFNPVQYVLYGGLAYPLFEGLGHSIDQTRRLNAIRISIVYHLECLLTKLKIIRPLFISAVMVKKKNLYSQQNWQSFLIKLIRSK